MACSIKEVTLVPAFTYGHAPRDSEFERCRAGARGTPDLPGAVITHRFALDDAAEAFRVAGDRSTEPSRWWSSRDRRLDPSTDATVVDGDAPSSTDAHVVVDGDRISAVGPGPVADRRPDDRVVDLAGRTVMPGMVNCHFHATYHNLGATPAPFGLEEPMALQAVRAVNSLELLVHSGFTSAVSAGAPFAIDASMKVAIEKGLITGPRLVPCSRDISTTGHAGDRSYPSHWQVGAIGAIRPSDGPDEFRRSVRAEIKEGAEIIKMFVTGGHGTIGPKEQIEMTREEMAAGIEAAHLRGARVRGHIANREAIMMALDLDIDVIDHGDGMDEECIERIVEAGTPLVPSMLFPARFLDVDGRVLASASPTR